MHLTISKINHQITTKSTNFSIWRIVTYKKIKIKIKQRLFSNYEGWEDLAVMLHCIRLWLLGPDPYTGVR